jgi:hypothetical protein
MGTFPVQVPINMQVDFKCNMSFSKRAYSYHRTLDVSEM